MLRQQYVANNWGSKSKTPPHYTSAWPLPILRSRFELRCDLWWSQNVLKWALSWHIRSSLCQVVIRRVRRISFTPAAVVQWVRPRSLVSNFRLVRVNAALCGNRLILRVLAAKHIHNASEHLILFLQEILLVWSLVIVLVKNFRKVGHCLSGRRQTITFLNPVLSLIK